MPGDRLKDSLFALVRAATPRLDYYALYFGRVIVFRPDEQSVDVQPNDARLPTMSHVPFRHGIPGLKIENLVVGPPTPDASVLVGWENGDPARRFACLWSAATVEELTLNATMLNLGGRDGAEPSIKGLTFNGNLGTFLAALAAYLPIVQPIADPTGTATTTMLNAIAALEAALPGALATNARVR